MLTIWDLFRFNSVRPLSISLGLIFTCIAFLYYAPVMLVNEFGFDFYLNGVLVNGCELVTYFYTYFYIEKMERRWCCLAFLLGTLLCSTGLVFTQTKQICTYNCFKPRLIVELLLVAAMRLCVAL